MKVEIDLDSEQLTLLDSSLKDLVLSLTPQQQTELLQNYINTQLESFRVAKESGYYGHTEYKYTDFGKQITDEMSNRVKDAITSEMLSNEELVKYMDEVIENVKKNLQTIIETSISSYIVNNLFQDKSSLEHIIKEKIYRMRGNNEI